MSIEKYSYKVCVLCEKFINVFVSINRAPRHIWLLIRLKKLLSTESVLRVRTVSLYTELFKAQVVGREKLGLLSSWEVLDFPMGKLRKSKKGEMIVECNKQR